MVLFPQETMLRHSWSKRLWRACREPRKKTVAVFQDEPECHMFMNNLCQLNMSMLYIYYSNMLGYFMKLYWISNLVLFVRSRLKSIRIGRFPLHQSICMRSIGSFLWWRETSDQMNTFRVTEAIFQSLDNKWVDLSYQERGDKNTDGQLVVETIDPVIRWFTGSRKGLTLSSSLVHVSWGDKEDVPTRLNIDLSIFCVS